MEGLAPPRRSEQSAWDPGRLCVTRVFRTFEAGSTEYTPSMLLFVGRVNRQRKGGFNFEVHNVFSRFSGVERSAVGLEIPVLFLVYDSAVLRSD